MNTQTKKKMLVMLTSGPADRGNGATLAFTMGVSALISGVETTIFMTMAGSFWSREGSVRTVRIEGFEPLAEYVEQFIALGGKILVCSPCSEFFCSPGATSGLIEGAELAGLTHIVDIALDSTVVTL